MRKPKAREKLGVPRWGTHTLRPTLLAALLFPVVLPAQYPSFLKTQGRSIVDAQGQPVLLRGVAFGNEVWSDVRIPTRHHGEADYRRVAAMNMNVIRFYLNYKTFESDANPYAYLPDGWAWLDSNVAWARRNRIYLFLNMHVPPGGFQSLGGGQALWTIRENQRRLKALWHAIAARYREEPALAGFDLLNEPGVPVSRDQWKTLAQELVDTIRVADPRRMLIVERTNSVNGDWGEDADRNFFLVRDANTAYTFHFYLPFEFSHQYASWTSPPLGEGGRYPDSSRITLPEAPKWAAGSFQNPILSSGTTGWTFFSGVKFPANDGKYHLAKPVVASNKNPGTVWFDDLVLREFDAGGNALRAIPLGLESMEGWDYWSADGKGSLAREASGCHGGGGCLRIGGTSADANASGNGERLIATLGHSYSIEGYMKGADVAPGAKVQLRVDFETAVNGAYRRDKVYLASQVDAYLAWGARHDVPLYLGEFGVIDSAFSGGRGGLAWVSDMIDIAAQRSLSFTYHAYHEQAFGIYKGNGAVDTLDARQDLIKLFRDKLGAMSGIRRAGNQGRKPSVPVKSLSVHLSGGPVPESRKVDGRKSGTAHTAAGVQVRKPVIPAPLEGP